LLTQKCRNHFNLFNYTRNSCFTSLTDPFVRSMKAASGSSRSIIARIERHLFSFKRRNVLLFSSIRAASVISILKEQSSDGIKGYREAKSRNASFEEIPRSERFLVLFSPEPDLSASSSCRRWLIERASSVPLRRLWDPRLGLRGIVKKKRKGIRKIEGDL